MSTYAQRVANRAANGQRPHHGDMRAWIAATTQDRHCQTCNGPIRAGDVYIERLIPGTLIWAPIHRFCMT